MEHRAQLITNSDFRDGLRGWRASGSGVTLVRSGQTTLLSLSAKPGQPVSIVGDPARLEPGASYRLIIGTEMMEGRVVLRIVWATGTVITSSQEFTLEAPRASYEVQAPREAEYATVGLGLSEGRVWLRSVTLEPVGPRMEILELRTSQAVLSAGASSALLCRVANTGSEALEHPTAELRQGRELLEREAENEITLPTLYPGDSADIEWGLRAHEVGVFGAVVRVRVGTCQVERATDIVVSDEPFRPDPTRRGVWARRSFVTMAMPSFRMVLPKTELGFGVGHFELGDPLRFAGWVRSFAACLGIREQPPRALYGTRSRVVGATLTLSSKDALAEWEITITPKPERSRLALNYRYEARAEHRVHALQGIALCAADSEATLDYEEAPEGCAMVIPCGRAKYGVAIHWPEQGGNLGCLEGSKAVGGRLFAALLPSNPCLRPGSRLALSQEVWMGRARTAREALER